MSNFLHRYYSIDVFQSAQLIDLHAQHYSFQWRLLDKDETDAVSRSEELTGDSSQFPKVEF